MKNLLITTLLTTAFPAVALANACDDYYNKLEASMKQDGSYSDEAMKIVKDQVAAVPVEQQETFCTAALENMNAVNESDTEAKG